MFSPESFTKWKVLDMEQGTEEWLQWRRTGIGGSDAAKIMGFSAYDTAVDLWEEKTGLVIREQADNDAIRNGIELEPIARQEFIKLTDEYVEPLCGSHATLDFIKVSLDGITADGGLILEIKCPFRFVTHYKNSQRVPSYYYAQIQHQLMVTKADVACFYSYARSGGYMTEVYPDPRFMKDLLRREMLFWAHVELKKPINPDDFAPYEDYRFSEELMANNRSSHSTNADAVFKDLIASYA